MQTLLTSLRLFLWLTLITGVVYPLFITGFAYLAFNKANGQLISRNNQIVGSKLIGQQFSADKYFWGRPSAINYNPLPSGGSNLSPTSTILKQAVDKRRQHLLEKHPNQINVPHDLLYASGSGLDPHITLSAAKYQVERVAHARGINNQQLLELIDSMIEKRKFGLLGVPTINVLSLNVALDEKFEVK